jgi:hypothetical protein
MVFEAELSILVVDIFSFGNLEGANVAAFLHHLQHQKSAQCGNPLL